GMLVPAVASVDDGLLGFGRHAFGSAVLVMAHNDGVAQARDHGRAILERFARPGIRARAGHVLHADRMGAQRNRRGFEANACAGAWLKKQERDGLADSRRGEQLSMLEGLRGFAKPIDIVAVYGFGREQVIERLRTIRAEQISWNSRRRTGWL